MSEPEETLIGKCPGCGQDHAYPAWIKVWRMVPLCDPCGKRQEQIWKEKRQPTSWEVRYRRMLPDGYLKSETAKVPPCYARALDWTAEAHRGGLGLVGPSDAGKSSAMACLMWKLEKEFLWLSGTVAREVATQSAMMDHPGHAEACKRWQKAMTVPILVLDDVSQGLMSAAWSARLFDLLETRMNHGLPTLWTSQIPLEELRAKIARQNGGDTAQADAISRRLGQHSAMLRA